jgi:hypothetical protein
MAIRGELSMENTQKRFDGNPAATVHWQDTEGMGDVT